VRVSLLAHMAAKLFELMLDPMAKQALSICMKSHLFVALGLLLTLIFSMRGFEAFTEPGFGWRELYIIGGFIIAGRLIFVGLAERFARK